MAAPGFSKWPGPAVVAVAADADAVAAVAVHAVAAVALALVAVRHGAFAASVDPWHPPIAHCNRRFIGRARPSTRPIHAYARKTRPFSMGLRPKGRISTQI